jgi:L-ascorbate metabolism protein UlaG (beta-lactamase superfamily)
VRSPAEDTPLEVLLDPAGPRLTVWNLHHGRDRRPPVPHLGLVIEMDAFRVLHAGDTEISPDELARLDLAGRTPGTLDVALLPYWKVRGEAGKAILKLLGARHVLAIHLPRASAPRDWFGDDEDLDGLVASLSGIEGVEPIRRIGRRREI